MNHIEYHGAHNNISSKNDINYSCREDIALIKYIVYIFKCIHRYEEKLTFLNNTHISDKDTYYTLRGMRYCTYKYIS